MGKKFGSHLLLIDGDILLHRFAFANQYSIDWDGDGDHTEVMEVDRAIDQLDEEVTTLLKETKCRDYLFCISSDFNFRYKVLPTYKHNRSGSEKPKLFDLLKAHAQSAHNCVSMKRLEADDVMGILSTEQPERCVIATLDKDLLQIPGWHYNWNKKELSRTSGGFCDYWFLRQVLTGDSTDGYGGCPGIGPKKADKCLGRAFLDQEFDVGLGWSYVLEMFEAKGLTEEYAIQQARVARILRAGEYDRTSEEPVLWCPPK